MSPLANGGRPWKREKKRGINGDILEEKIFWKRYFWNLVEGKEGKKKEKEKEKKLYNEDIFLISKNENIGNTGSWV